MSLLGCVPGDTGDGSPAVFGKAHSNAPSAEEAPRIRTTSEGETIAERRRRTRSGLPTPTPDGPLLLQIPSERVALLPGAAETAGRSDAWLNDPGTVSRTARRRACRRSVGLVVALGSLVAAAAYLAFYLVLAEDAVQDPATDTPSRLVLRLLDSNSAAKYLDGRPSGYYYRRGSDDWVIYLEGGGFCDSPQSCEERTRSGLGSSRFWAPVREDTGILNRRSRLNPFWNATHVYVPYCGGDVHTGTQTQPNGYGLYHAGHLTVMAVMNDLAVTRNLTDADRVLVTGDSAGGIGVFQNVDYFKERLPDAVVKGSPMGGFYLPTNLSSYSEWRNGTEDSGFGRHLARQLHVLYSSKLNPACAAAHPSDVGDCGTVGVMAKYIKSPLLVSENIYDNNKLGLLGRPSYADDGPKYTAYYGERSMASVVTSLDAAAAPKENGYFMPACNDHVNNLGIDSDTSIHANASDYSSRLNYSVVLESWFYDLGDVPSTRLMDECALAVRGQCGECGYHRRYT